MVRPGVGGTPGRLPGSPGALGRLPAPGTAGGCGERGGRVSGGGAPPAPGGGECGAEGEAASPRTASGRAAAGGRDTEVALPRRLCPAKPCGAVPFPDTPGFPPCTLLCCAPSVGETLSREPAQAGAGLAVLLGEVTVTPLLQVI